MKTRRHKLAVLWTLLVLLLATPLLIGGQPTLAALTNLHFDWLLLFALLLVARVYFLGARFWLLFHAQGIRPGRLRTLAIVLASDFAAEATPASAGGPITLLGLFQKAGITVSTTLATGATVLVMDIAAVASIITISLLTLLAGAALPQTSTSVGILGFALGMFLLVWLTVIYRHFLIKRLEQLALYRHLPARHRATVKTHYTKLLQSLGQMDQLPAITLLIVYLYALINWGIRFSILFVALLANHQHPDWAITALIQFISTLAGMASLLPAGFPVADTSISALLAPHMATATIMAVLLLWRLMGFYFNFLAGGLAFLWLSVGKTHNTDTPADNQI